MTLPPDLYRSRLPSLLPFIAEGFCPYGHGPLRPVVMHGHDYGSCPACRCSWRIQEGEVWGSSCVPGSHTCEEGRHG